MVNYDDNAEELHAISRQAYAKDCLLMFDNKPEGNLYITFPGIADKLTFQSTEEVKQYLNS